MNQYKLQSPITDKRNGEALTELTVRAPKVKHLRAAAKESKDGTSVDVTAAMIGMCCDLDMLTVDELDLRDYKALSDSIAVFMPGAANSLADATS